MKKSKIFLTLMLPAAALSTCLVSLVAIGCSSQTIPNYAKQTDLFLTTATYPGDKNYSKGVADAYWYSLQKGKLISEIFKNSRFTKEGYLDTSFDFFDVFWKEVSPELKIRLTIEEKLSLDGGVALYFGKEMHNLARTTSSRGETDKYSIKISLIRKVYEEEEAVALRLQLVAIAGEEETWASDMPRVVERLNDFFSSASENSNKRAEMLFVYFGVFTDQKVTVDAKTTPASEKDDQVVGAFSSILENKLKYYELTTTPPDKSPLIKKTYDKDEKENEPSFFVSWQSSTNESNPFFDYYDINRINQGGPVVLFGKITFL